MRVLIVVSINRHSPAPFVLEQMKALQQVGCETELFGVAGRGVTGYLANLIGLKRKIRQFHPDIVHAHYGMCGLLAGLQRRIPVIITFHGSDINCDSAFRWSKVAMHLSDYNIFVSQNMAAKAGVKNNYEIIPCGVNIDELSVISKLDARRRLNLNEDKKYVLFASSFENEIKNPSLAKEAMKHITDAILLEFKGYSREEVYILLQAVDCLLMTSYSEGSPQVIKEALLCGTPIVSVPVGDVPLRIQGIEGCYLADYNEKSIADKLIEAIHYNQRTLGRDAIIRQGFDNYQIATRLYEIYKKVKKE